MYTFKDLDTRDEEIVNKYDQYKDICKKIISITYKSTLHYFGASEDQIKLSVSDEDGEIEINDDLTCDFSMIFCFKSEYESTVKLKVNNAKDVFFEGSFYNVSTGIEELVADIGEYIWLALDRNDRDIESKLRV